MPKAGASRRGPKPSAKPVPSPQPQESTLSMACILELPVAVQLFASAASELLEYVERRREDHARANICRQIVGTAAALVREQRRGETLAVTKRELDLRERQQAIDAANILATDRDREACLRRAGLIA